MGDATNQSGILRRLLAFLAALLILKVTLSVIVGYRNYLPPNFRSDFLIGREAYFFAHISGRSTRILWPGPLRSCWD